MRSPFYFCLVSLFLFLSSSALAAKPKVLKISTVSDLDFGTGSPGDFSKTISPGTSETSTNASFSVTGEPNTAYTITLPSSATLQTGNGNKKDTINLSNFQSFPIQGANGLLDTSGNQMVFIGATRDSLKTTQLAGSYSGSFSITVVY